MSADQLMTVLELMSGMVLVVGVIATVLQVLRASIRERRARTAR